MKFTICEAIQAFGSSDANNILPAAFVDMKHLKFLFSLDK